MIAIEGILDHYGVEYDPAKAGNQQVLCPFHQEKHKSASVNLDKGLFNCYGCDVAGDAIELVMVQEGVEFREAKRIAEELAGPGGRAVSRSDGRGDSLLPRKQGHRPGRRGWKPPWTGSRA